MTRIVEHLSVEDLERRYRAAQEATEARHTQVIWLLAQGRSVLDVAGVLAFAPRWVEQLAARYNAHGPDTLGDQRRRNGRAASVLTPALLAALAARLKEPPEDGGRWSGPKVALWMAARLGVERVHPQRGWEALKRVRWSPQMPRPRHPRSATAEQRAEFKGGSTQQSRRPGPSTRTGRSRSGRPTSTASG
jgi:transposase